MATQKRRPSLLNLRDPEIVRVERDRQIAISFLRKGAARTAVRDIVDETGLPRRTVYRAINRQLAWARTHQEAPAASDIEGDPGQGPAQPPKGGTATHSTPGAN